MRYRFASRGGRAAKLTGAIIAGLALVGGMLTVGSPTASAIDGSQFDPGYIISDAQFYAADSMSEDEIQAFLYREGPRSCNLPAHPGYTCLYDLSFPTFAKTANPMCGAYTGSPSESVARILSKVSAACGISPKVLLVMLQKEQGLITDTWPTSGQLATAMGAGCPDTAACDPAQKGFFQQVYLAAYYMIRYGMPPGTGPGTGYTSNYRSNYRIGETSNILYQANSPGCGTRSVVIRNQATASLYWYTPYTPNAAALGNLYGVGDGCSAYGNRNFWVYFNNWFGSPTSDIVPAAATTRIQGADRFATAVQISKVRGATATTVYIASGLNYPDALSAAPAATVNDGPLLLVQPNLVPPVVAAELARLKPRQIVVVGGATSVSAAVYAQLSTLAPAIRRDGGVDRFETSRTIAASGFPAGSALAYIATGQNFADALTAGSAAGSKRAPVILVNGLATKADTATLNTLRSLGVKNVIISGGPVAVSEGIASSLGAAGIGVTRIGGKDRFAVAGAINKNAFATSPTIYLAVAGDFPDALAGAALAGSKNSALLLAQGNCVYRQTAQDIIDLKASNVVLLGGTSVLSGSLTHFANCD